MEVCSDLNTAASLPTAKEFPVYIVRDLELVWT